MLRRFRLRGRRSFRWFCLLSFQTLGLPLVGGAFNCYDSVFDKFGGAPSLDSVFKGFKSGCRLGDVWRFKHSQEKQFTWFNADLIIASRLDSFLIPKSSYHLIISCDIFPCTYSDHDFVILN